VKKEATVAAKAKKSQIPSRSHARTNIDAATSDRKTNGTWVMELNEAQKKSGWKSSAAAPKSASRCGTLP
jgi:hypothetical protein